MNVTDSYIFEGLNKPQYEAVNNTDGAALIIAGAGSGKTRVLTCRIAKILERGASADSILALTFTNKASREMKERIASVVGERVARHLWMGTFHSVFIRFLRQEASLLGFPVNFTIYDTQDSRNIIKGCVKDLKLDEKLYKPAEVLNRISMAKNNLVTADAYIKNGTILQNDAAHKKPKICDIYKLYSDRCKTAGAMDFDDILLYTNILFRDFPEALERIASRFNYLLVDEYQDTNFAQYLIIKKLAQRHGNIAVVGDDSQSIYAFRGARIENILNFQKDYPNAKIYRLEQNYRSTQTIVNAANSLIDKNKGRIKKRCFSEAELGEQVELLPAFTEQEEGLKVASSILEYVYRDRVPYSSFAILYRTNAQSRSIEEALRKRNIPYKIYAGHSFYERAEVKDMLAYFKFLVNEKDDEAFRRIVNFPARGIGATTLSRLVDLAKERGLSISETIAQGNLEESGIKSATAQKISGFVQQISEIRSLLAVTDAYKIAQMIDSTFGIMANMRLDTSLEGMNRVENVTELFNSVQQFVEDGEEEYETLAADGYDVPIVTMDLYLEDVSLISDLDTKEDEEDNNKVSLMTVHSSKGLEFGHVYVVGMEENLFPSTLGALSENEIEEERRLFYVAMTRAQKVLKLSFSRSRMKWGTHTDNTPSRFLKEIDRQYISNPLSDFREEITTKFGYSSFGGNSSESYGRKSSSTIKHSTYNAAHSAHTTRTTHTAPSGGGKPVSSFDFKADSPSDIKSGQRVEHFKFGMGTVAAIEDDRMGNMKAIVDFDSEGRKTLLLKYAKLRIVR